jgi:hypothetical protein
MTREILFAQAKYLWVHQSGGLPAQISRASQIPYLKLPCSLVKEKEALTEKDLGSTQPAELECSSFHPG